MSLFTSIIDTVKRVVTRVKERNFKDLLLDLVGLIPTVIRDITTLVDMKNSDGHLSQEEIKTLIDDALQEFDDNTGVEGVTIIKGYGAVGGEEQTLDLFKYLIRNISYLKAGIPIPDETIIIPYVVEEKG